MKTFLALLLLAIRSATAIDLSFLTKNDGGSSSGPPISKACNAAMAKLSENAAFNATQAKVDQDQEAVGKQIGSACSAKLAACKAPDGATMCCTEDAFADGLWKSGMADLTQYQADAQKVDSSAELCMFNIDYIFASKGVAYAFSFENYVPKIWPADMCTAADGAAYMVWAGGQCVANGKAHGALACIFSYSDDHCPGHHNPPAPTPGPPGPRCGGNPCISNSGCIAGCTCLPNGAGNAGICGPPPTPTPASAKN